MDETPFPAEAPTDGGVGGGFTGGGGCTAVGDDILFVRNMRNSKEDEKEFEPAALAKLLACGQTASPVLTSLKTELGAGK